MRMEAQESKKMVVVVEDNASLRMMLCEKLRKENYKVTEAENGEEALDMVVRHKPDLVILDVILPRMTGFEVLEKIRHISEVKDVPVMLLTNLESMENVERALRLGATNYLVKADYSLEEITQKVNEFMTLQVQIVKE